ncbi:hypothetical protein MCEMSE15_02117 [Fimbriimonadaceae bacterium]
MTTTNFGIVGGMGGAERVYLWGAIFFGGLALLLAVSRRGGLAGLLSVSGMAAVCVGCDLYLVGLKALGISIGTVGVVVSLAGMTLEVAWCYRRPRNRA